MKFLLAIPIILFTFSIATTAKIEVENIPFEKTDLHCAIKGEETFFINSENEYKKLIREQSSCYPFNAATIDFQKYSLIGITESVGGCSFPEYSQTITKDNITNVYEVNVTITTKGICKMLYQVNEWCLVPKIDSSISTVHFNIKK